MVAGLDLAGAVWAPFDWAGLLRAPGWMIAGLCFIGTG
jgi:hypothetical protein